MNVDAPALFPLPFRPLPGHATMVGVAGKFLDLQGFQIGGNTPSSPIIPILCTIKFSGIVESKQILSYLSYDNEQEAFFLVVFLQKYQEWH